MRTQVSALLSMIVLAGCGSSDNEADRPEDGSTNTNPTSLVPIITEASVSETRARLQVRRVIQDSPNGSGLGASNPAPSPTPTCGDVQQRLVTSPRKETWVCFSQPGTEAGADLNEVLHLAPAEIVGGVRSATAMEAGGGQGWVVVIEFDDEAAEAFAAISHDLYATQGRVAFLLGGTVLTAPAMMSPDLSDQVQISVTDRVEAQWLAAALESPGS